MATLGELKTRIRLETNKDDIASGGEAEAALTRAINRAIDYYSNESFWFNQARASATTTGGTQTVALPAALRSAKRVIYSNAELLKRGVEDMDATTSTGSPDYWAEDGSNIRLHPIPDAVYSLTIVGLSSTATPSTDTASNYWTTEAEDLISARARMLLYRDLWQDGENMKLAAQAEADEFTRLMRETARRRARLMVTDIPPLRNRFNITTG